MTYIEAHALVAVWVPKDGVLPPAAVHNLEGLALALVLEHLKMPN